MLKVTWEPQGGAPPERGALLLPVQGPLGLAAQLARVPACLADPHCLPWAVNLCSCHWSERGFVPLADRYRVIDKNQLQCNTRAEKDGGSECMLLM